MRAWCLVQERTRRRRAEAAAKGAASKAKGGAPPQTKYPDEEGALGPNGLPRMKGGNPSGGPCKGHFEGGGCRFKTCPYSHTRS